MDEVKSIDCKLYQLSNGENEYTLMQLINGENEYTLMQLINEHPMQETDETWNISMTGKLCPLFPETTTIHMNEWIFFDSPIDEIKKNLKILDKEKNEILNLEQNDCCDQMNIEIFVEKVIRRWLSYIKKSKNAGEDIPIDILSFMRKIFMNLYNKEKKYKKKNYF